MSPNASMILSGTNPPATSGMDGGIGDHGMYWTIAQYPGSSAAMISGMRAAPGAYQIFGGYSQNPAFGYPSYPYQGNGGVWPVPPTYQTHQPHAPHYPAPVPPTAASCDPSNPLSRASSYSSGSYDPTHYYGSGLTPMPSSSSFSHSSLPPPASTPVYSPSQVPFLSISFSFFCSCDTIHSSLASSVV